MILNAKAPLYLGLVGLLAACSSAQPSQIVFTAQPSSVAAGATFSPTVQVSVEAVTGTVIDSTAPISLTLTGGTPGAVLAGTVAANAVDGVATFPGLSINLAGSGYQLLATSGTWTATSAPFTVTAGLPSALVFTVQPAAADSGEALSPAVQVSMLDGDGNVIPSAAGAVSIAIANSAAPGAVLSGTLTVNAVAGVASFSDLSINKAGSGYTLIASANGYPSATSHSFDISASQASSSTALLTAGPDQVTADGVSTTNITATARDGQGNPIAGAAVTLAVSGSGNTLSLSSGSTDANGVLLATLASTTAGTKTITANIGGITKTATITFVAGAASADTSTFTIDHSTLAGDGVSTATLTLTALDAQNNPVVGQSVSLSASGSSNTLTPASGVTNASGVFTSKLSSTALQTETLTAVFGGVSESVSVTIVLGVASALTSTIALHPSSVVADGTSTATVVVTTRDPGGQLLSGQQVQLSSSGTNTLFGASQGTTGDNGTFTTTVSSSTVQTEKISAFVGGVTFSSGTLSFISGSPDANHSTFTAAPPSITADGSSTISLTVTAIDAGNNPIPSLAVALSVKGASQRIHFSNDSGTTAADGTFTATVTSTVAQTVTLQAVFGGLTELVTVTFQAGLANGLVFAQQPTDSTGGAQITPSVQVAVVDANNNVVTTSTAAITLALGANPGSGSLLGTLTENAVNGVATFSDPLAVNTIGSGYTLVASADGLGSATSNTFDITEGGPASLAFTQQPANTAAGATLAPVVISLEDLGGNVRTDDSSSTVTVFIATNPSGGTLSGTLTQTAINGLVTFPDLSIDLAGSGYVLGAVSDASSDYAPQQSSPFNITGANVYSAVFTTQPQSGSADNLLGTIVVTLEDQSGAAITSDSTTSVSLGFGSNPGKGHLSGNTNVTAVNGVATFTGIGIDKAGTGYTLTATATGYLTGTSNSFNISAGQPSMARFDTEPSAGAAGLALKPSTVVLLDANGNLINDSQTDVTVALNGQEKCGNLSGTLTRTAVSGTATFDDLVISKPALGYTLSLSVGGGYTGQSSEAFNVYGAMTTVAGQGTAAFSDGTGGAGGTAKFNAPSGIARDGSGNLIVADTANNRIRSIDSSGNVTTIAGDGTSDYNDGAALQAEFGNIVGLAIGSDGQIYIADPGNGTVRVISADRTTVSSLVPAGTFSSGPASVAIDSNLNVFVTVGNAIEEIDSSGNVTLVAGDVATAAYIDGSRGPTGTARFNGPTGIAVDQSGNLYVADTNNNAIRKIFISSGEVITFAGGSAGIGDGFGTAATFSAPQAITVDGQGTLSLIDVSSCSIRQIDAFGNTATLVGAPGCGYADGAIEPASAAAFYPVSPSGIAVDAEGNLYIGDSGNNRIRKVLPNASVVSVCGGGSGVAGPTIVQASPADGSDFTSIPAAITVKFSKQPTLGADVFSLAGNCDVQPTIASISGSGLLRTIALSSGSCSVGEQLVLLIDLANLIDTLGNPGLGYAAVTLVDRVPTYLVFEGSGTNDGSFGGPSAADQLCQAAASQRALSSALTFKAMVVDGVNRIACSSANCGTSGAAEGVDWVLQPAAQYVRPDGTPVAATDTNGLLTFPLTNSIGASAGSVWTGLSSDWTTSANNCSGWTTNNSGVSGAQGSAGASDSTAISASPATCDTSVSFYCVQQP